MQYVVCYDITDDRRRSRIASLLLDFGVRVQESVFVAHLDDDLFERMRERITQVIDGDWDKLHVFALCAACERKGWTLGQGQIVDDPPWYIV
jgi:CRISPR-associated protein Cas2